MQIYITKESALWQDDMQEIAHEIALRVCKVTGWHEFCEVSLSLVDDVQITELNTIWRDKPEPTDVLSFPQFTREELKTRQKERQEQAIVWGDVVISWDTLQRQAQEQNKDWQLRFQELWVHGLLHLLGYDHEDDAQMAQEMYEIEDQILIPE